MKELSITNIVSPLLLKLKLKGVTRRSFETFNLFNRTEVSWLKPGISLILDKLTYSKNLYIEDDLFNFSNQKMVKILEKKLILGYFQSKTLVDMVFASLNSRIKNFVTLKKPQSGIALHIRGADYLHEKNRNYHGKLSLDYYDQAIDKIKENKKNLRVIHVVTDDIEYSMNFMKSSNYFSLMRFEKNNNPWHDLVKLTQFDSVVLANSSFSWWAGCLAFKNFDAQIFIPKMWTTNVATQDTDLYYNEWTLV